MCIIVAKDSHVKMPDWSTLKTCWTNNPDGAGFMYAHDNRVYIQKGFMTWKSFKKALKNLETIFSLDSLPLVMHFRISTQGGVNPQNTHPFPITDDVERLISPKESSPIGGMAHNGIIPKYSSYKTASAYSDTLLFVKDAVNRAIHHPRDLENTQILTSLEKIASSKLAFLSPNGTIKLLGSFNMDEGVAYSNYTWYPYARYYSGKTGSNWYAPYASWYDYEDAYDYEDYGCSYDHYLPAKYRQSGMTACMKVWECDPDIHNYVNKRGDHVPTVSNCYYDSWGYLWVLKNGYLAACDEFVYDPENRVVRHFPKEHRILPVEKGYESYINDFTNVTFVKS